MQRKSGTTIPFPCLDKGSTENSENTWDERSDHALSIVAVRDARLGRG